MLLHIINIHPKDKPHHDKMHVINKKGNNSNKVKNFYRDCVHIYCCITFRIS